MHPYVQSLHKRRNEARTEATALLDRAEREHRDLRPDEEERFQRLTDKLRNVRDQLDRWEQNEASMEAGMANIDPGLRAAVTEGQGELRAAFDTYASAGFAAFDSYPTWEARALQSAGGSAVETSFIDSVHIYLRDETPMLDGRYVTILSRPDGAPLKVPRLTSDVAFGGTVVPEAGTINLADPTISAVTLQPWKLASISLWSAELAQDAAFDLSSLVAKSAARDIAYDAGTLLTLGTGTVQPWGIVTRATNGGTAVGGGTAVPGGDTFINWQDLATLYGAVPVPAQNRGTFMMSPAMYVKALKWRDLQGQPIVQQGIGGTPASIFGRPVVLNPAMAAPGSATKPVLFGALDAYFVAEVQPTRVELSREFAYQTDSVAVKVVSRLDGDLIDVGAVAVMTCANS